MAKTISATFFKDCKVSGLYDIDTSKARKLSKQLKLNGAVKKSLNRLMESADCVVEAVNSDSACDIITQALKTKKSVLVMSVGKILNYPELFKLAKINKCYILLPSGAIAGLDAIKAASLAGIKNITLTTRKPPSGFKSNPYFDRCLEDFRESLLAGDRADKASFIL